MKRAAILVLAGIALTGCRLRYALLGFPEPVVTVAPKGEPVEFGYREAKGAGACSSTIRESAS